MGALGLRRQHGAGAQGERRLAISTYSYTGAGVSTRPFQNTGWPVRASFSDGQAPPSATSSGWYVYFTDSPDVAVTISVNARVEAALDDGSASATNDFDSSPGTSKRVNVAFRAASSTVKLIVRYRVLSRKNTTSNAAILIAAATLR